MTDKELNRGNHLRKRIDRLDEILKNIRNKSIGEIRPCWFLDTLISDQDLTTVERTELDSLIYNYFSKLRNQFQKEFDEL